MIAVGNAVNTPCIYVKRLGVHSDECPRAVDISKDSRLIDLGPKFYHWSAFAVAVKWGLELLHV